jgi:hypothetical protein
MVAGFRSGLKRLVWADDEIVRLPKFVPEQCDDETEKQGYGDWFCHTSLTQKKRTTLLSVREICRREYR